MKKNKKNKFLNKERLAIVDDDVFEELYSKQFDDLFLLENELKQIMLDIITE